MIFQRACTLLFLATLAACGAGGQNPNPDGHVSELKPGQSWTMGKDQTLKVPSGSTVYTSSATSTTEPTIITTTFLKVEVGAILKVPLDATGPAVITVTTVQ